MGNDTEEFLENAGHIDIPMFELSIDNADKTTIKQIAHNLYKASENSPKEGFVLLKALEKAIAEAKALIESSAMLNMDDKETILGADVQIINYKSSYDFKEDEEIKLLKEKIKKREDYLKAMYLNDEFEEIDKSTGELKSLIKPKITHPTQSIKVSFK
jgi:hypothetical protein